MKSLDRRTFLRGAGLSLGLPLLDAMNSDTSVFAAAPQSVPNRMAFIFFQMVPWSSCQPTVVMPTCFHVR